MCDAMFCKCCNGNCSSIQHIIKQKAKSLRRRNDMIQCNRSLIYHNDDNSNCYYKPLCCSLNIETKYDERVSCCCCLFCTTDEVIQIHSEKRYDMPPSQDMLVDDWYWYDDCYDTDGHTIYFCCKQVYNSRLTHEIMTCTPIPSILPPPRGYYNSSNYHPSENKNDNDDNVCRNRCLLITLLPCAIMISGLYCVLDLTQLISVNCCCNFNIEYCCLCEFNVSHWDIRRYHYEKMLKYKGEEKKKDWIHDEVVNSMESSRYFDSNVSDLIAQYADIEPDNNDILHVLGQINNHYITDS